MKPTLEYNDGKHLMPKNTIRIGASQISKYFTSTSKWFRENLHGEDGFIGSTASVLGTIVHYYLECYVTNQPESKLEIDKYIAEQSAVIPDLDIDYIYYQLPFMVEVAKLYIDSNGILQQSPTSEQFVIKQMNKQVYIGGSIDLTVKNFIDVNGLHQPGTCIVDYKTTSSKQRIKSIPYGYKLQALTYAKILRDEGVDVTHYRIVYISTNIDGGLSERTGKPLKSYPSETYVLEEHITEKDLEMMDNIFSTISDAVLHYIENPSHRGIIGQDNRLKSLHCLYKPMNEEI